MVRTLDVKFIKNGCNYREFSGLSTDTKPTEGLATGSSFFEVDTNDVYFWDEESETWMKAGGE